MPLGSVQNVETLGSKSFTAVKSADSLSISVRASDIQQAAENYLLLIGKEQSKPAFAALFAYYAPKINQYMLKMGASSACADELTQEAFLAVWNKARLYCPQKASPSTWLYTIARNKFFDLMRRERRAQLNSILYPSGNRENENTDEHLSQIQVQKEVRDALHELPQNQYEIVFKMYMEGKTQDHIAKELDVPVGTVKSRARLAYAKLKKQLDVDA